MRSVGVRDGQFTGADGQPLPLRVYDPLTPVASPAPVVLLLEGYPSAGFEKHMGCRFMEMEWTISMAQLIAASGMTAITHANHDPEADALALIDHLKKQNERIGIWSISGHGPVALKAAAHATCAVLINPITKDFCPDTPLFVVRAGRDETPGLNAALDAFVARAMADDRPITVLNYPGAPHAFDLLVESAETGWVLQQGLNFLRSKLGYI
jgi:acetyl esterase/lipase